MRLFGLEIRAAHDAGPSARDELDDFWYNDIGSASPAGVNVTEAAALKVPAVYDCLQTIADPIATLPLVFFRRGAAGTKKPVEAHPLAALLRERPNPWTTAAEFRGQMQWDLGLHHKAFAEIRPGPSGPIGTLHRLPPLQVQAEWRDGEAWYIVQHGGVQRRLHDSQIWHLRAPPFMPDGLNTWGKLETARDAIGKAIAVQAYGARFFKNNTQGGGVIENEFGFKDDTARRNFLASWRHQRGGAHAHRDSVLEKGMKYQRGGATNVESQFIDAQKEAALDIARYWHVQPHKIGILDRATFSNIAEQSIEFVQDTLLPWLVIWEQAIKRDLILLDPTLYAEFNVLGLLRGAIKARFEAYAKARNGGWLSVNDIRKLENMEPIGPEGDEYIRPMNMVPVGTPAPPPKPVRGTAVPAAGGNGHDPGPVPDSETGDPHAAD